MTTSTLQKLYLPEAPTMEGLSFRNFRDEFDYPHMLAIINASKTADHEERHDTLEEMIHNYSHLTNCDLSQDLVLAEIQDQVIAYSRVTWWEEEATGNRMYLSFGFVHPDWRRKGIGTAMLKHNQRRLRQIAAAHPEGVERFFESFANNFQPGNNALLEKDGYTLARQGFMMVRPDLENIPDLPLPEGLEVRPARPEHYRQIWEASQEAFRDHWGYAEPVEDDYVAWLGASEFQPELWQVAWDGDQVAGMILNFINHGENEEYHRKRGWTEGISVRRPWRRRGLARALLARSFKMHKALGMTEAALGVDSENPNGARQLYESMGFQMYRINTTYRKPME